MRIPRFKINRVFFLLFAVLIFAGFIIIKMFQLQVISHRDFLAKAEDGHLGYSEVGARRGEILIQDYHSKEVFRLATNTSFPLIFADPTLVKDPVYLADKLAPLLFDKRSADEKDARRIRNLKRRLPDNPTKEELAAIAPKSEDDMRKDFRSEIYEKLSQKTRQEIILYKAPTEEMLKFFEKTKLPGVEVTSEEIKAFPSQIGDREYTARIL